MRKYIYQTLIVMVTGFVSCSEQKNQEKMETVSGQAQNSPQGALIVNKSGKFIIEGKQAWENELLDKRLEVTGNIVYSPASTEESYNGHTLQKRTIRQAQFKPLQ